MSGFFLGKYGVQTTFTFPMVKRGAVDLAQTGDWTPASTDAAISKDGGNAADTTNTVAVVGGSPTRGTAMWSLTLTATEMQAARITVQIVDAATKAVEDNVIAVHTYGNASAAIVFDLSVATQKVDVDTIKTQAVTLSGGVTIPAATLASTTNLTAGTIATVTNGVTIATASRPGIRKNTALANFQFIMTDSTNHNPATGLTVTATRAIDNGGFGAGTLSAVTEITSGWYRVDFGAGDLNGDTVAVRCTATGADDLDFTIVTTP